jgi:glycosyltransferase involved in cell wall biosynthesis
MIGIGVTTYNRPNLALSCLANIKKYTTEPYELYIAVDSDSDRQGVAKRKNECLKALKDCDYIFLFDDDCYPIKEGWEKAIIDKSKKTKSHHFCFNKEPFYEIKGYQFINGIELECFGACGGVMLFYTNEVIRKVGAFYEGYDTYGFEHIGHSIRIFRSGLSADLFCCPTDMKEYLYSHDYDDKDFFSTKSTIDLQTKNQLTLKNKEICNTQDTKIYIPFI